MRSNACAAPFGILDDYDNIIAENTSEAYAAEFAQWEELVSRRLFRAHGFGVDRIAASMHEYVETRRDGEVLTAAHRTVCVSMRRCSR